MATFVTRCLSIFYVLIFTVAPKVPKLVVPNFSDLAIKTRHTSSDQKSGTPSSEVHALYLKASRQRIETLHENPAHAAAQNSAAISQCDEKRHFFLNQRDKNYYSSVIEDRSEQWKKAHPVGLPQMPGGEVNMSIVKPCRPPMAALI
jgi:hypothetical protein